MWGKCWGKNVNHEMTSLLKLDTASESLLVFWVKELVIVKTTWLFAGRCWAIHWITMTPTKHGLVTSKVYHFSLNKNLC